MLNCSLHSIFKIKNLHSGGESWWLCQRAPDWFVTSLRFAQAVWRSLQVHRDWALLNCSLHSIFKIKIFIPAVIFDGFATEHQTDLLPHFVLHKPSDVLFKLTAISLCSIVPSDRFIWDLSYFLDDLNAVELYSGKRQCLSVGKSQIAADNVSTTFRIVP